MPAYRPLLRRILFLAVLLCLLMLVCPRAVHAAQQPAAKPRPTPAPSTAPQKESPDQQEQQALQEAFRAAQGNPQALVRSLEDFLIRFPKSQRRDQVLRLIYKQAMQANDPTAAASAAERLLELNPDDPGLLSSLVDLYSRQSDPRSQERALLYASKFAAVAEKVTRPPDVSSEVWKDTESLLRATAYLMRGKIYAKMGENAKALPDFEKSYAAYPTAQVAERLGDLLSRMGQADRAIDAYATAFTFPEKSSDPGHREDVRRKLGSLYLARHGSEQGLGDLVLARYDDLMRQLAARFKSEGAPNTGFRDPFDFVLERPDGSRLNLADYRGKVVVMDFWATWCGPCRVEGKLLERAMERFRQEPAAAFLAVNVDEDRAGVPAFLKEEQWAVPVAYAQGLDHLLGIRALPTLMIFDRQGHVVFRQEGLDFSTFVPTVEQHVREALGQSTPTPAASR